MRVFASVLMLLIILQMSCGQNGNSPVSSNDVNVDREDIPAKVQKVMEYYAPDENGVSLAGVACPAPMDVSDMLDPRYEVYIATYLWGRLQNAATDPSEPTEWSGTLSVTGSPAYVFATQTIDFEPGQDSVLQHDAPVFAAWVSFTDGDFDGITCLVILDKENQYTDPVYLDFETVSFDLQLDFEELVDFAGFYEVDNVNAVAVHIQRIWPPECLHGLMSGEWVKDDLSGQQGHFAGLWLVSNGDTSGYYSGIFWINADGYGEFSGSVSGYYTDQVIASLEGSWYYDDPRMCPLCGTGHGVFYGSFEYVDGSGWGRIKGIFGDWDLPPESLTMPMQGTWREHCGNTGTPGQTSFF
jgi:hypothetical protein